MSHERQQKKRASCSTLWNLHPSLCTPQHNCQPLFVLNYSAFKGKEQQRVVSVLLRYRHNTAILGIYNSSMLLSGSSWLFVSVCDAREAKKVRRVSVSMAASWRLSKRGVHLALEANWGMINENYLFSVLKTTLYLKFTQKLSTNEEIIHNLIL